MNTYGAFLGGANWLMHAAGWQEGGLTASYEKFILDIEMCQMLAEVCAPVAVDDAELALEAITDVGPGGHFFGTEHTLARFETAFYEPLVFPEPTSNSGPRRAVSEPMSEQAWCGRGPWPNSNRRKSQRVFVPRSTISSNGAQSKAALRQTDVMAVDPDVGQMRTKATRQDWIDAALAALESEPIDQLRILSLASVLNVSRSSFYWYFSTQRNSETNCLHFGNTTRRRSWNERNGREYASWPPAWVSSNVGPTGVCSTPASIWRCGIGLAATPTSRHASPKPTPFGWPRSRPCSLATGSIRMIEWSGPGCSTTAKSATTRSVPTSPWRRGSPICRTTSRRWRANGRRPTNSQHSPISSRRCTDASEWSIVGRSGAAISQGRVIELMTPSMREDPIVVDVRRSHLVRHPVVVDCARIVSAIVQGRCDVVVFEDNRCFVVASSMPDPVLQPRHPTASERAVRDGVERVVDASGNTSVGFVDTDGRVAGAITAWTTRSGVHLDVWNGVARQVTSVLSDASRDESFFEAAVQGLRDTVIVLSPDMEIMWVNAAAGSLLGRTPAEAIGRSAVEFVHPDDMAMTVDAISRMQQGLEMFRLTVRLLGSAGNWVPVEVTGVDHSLDPTLGGLVLSLRFADYESELGTTIDRVERMSKAIVSGLRDGIVADRPVRCGHRRQ